MTMKPIAIIVLVIVFAVLAVRWFLHQPFRMGD
jgi:hypothetical protein